MMKRQMHGSGKKSTLTITCEQMASTSEIYQIQEGLQELQLVPQLKSDGNP